MRLKAIAASLCVGILAILLAGAGSGSNQTTQYPSPFDSKDKRFATLVSVFVEAKGSESEHLLRSARLQDLNGRQFLVGTGTAIGEQKTIESDATVWLAWDSVVRIIPWSTEQFQKNKDYRR